MRTPTCAHMLPFTVLFMVVQIHLLMIKCVHVTGTDGIGLNMIQRNILGFSHEFKIQVFGLTPSD